MVHNRNQTTEHSSGWASSIWPWEEVMYLTA